LSKGLPDVPDLRWYLIQEEAQQRHSSLRASLKSDHLIQLEKNAVMGRWHWAGFQV
jgi:hypothetical protein